MNNRNEPHNILGDGRLSLRKLGPAVRGLSAVTHLILDMLKNILNYFTC